MVAHSFRGQVFGAAQRLHGATYVVDLEVRRETLDEHGLVVDIGLASAALKSTLSEFAYHNLDDLPEFQAKNTTTEFMAKVIFDRMKQRIEDGELGTTGIHSMRVSLHESHVAAASFEGPL